MSNIFGQFPSASPEGVVKAPKSSKFIRDGERFYLSKAGTVEELYYAKKAFLKRYENEPWFASINENIITFETPYETWIKVGNGDNKKGWARISSKRSFATVIEPEPITILGDIQSAMAGNNFSYFLKTNGDLYSCGDNSWGNLGLGFTSDKESASLCLTNVKKITNGVYSYHGFALKNDNTLWGTGMGGFGQFGNGTSDNYDVWTQIDLQGDITGSGTIVDFGVNDNISALLMSDNSLWICGSDFSFGVISSIPVLISTDVKTFALGGDHLLYVKNDGTLFGIGYNGSGELGTGDYTDHNYDDPVQIDTNVKSVGAGGNHSGYVKNDDTLWMMGYNDYGQLGVGDTYERNVPVQIDTNVRFVTGGDIHTVYIKNDNTLWGMGSNSAGQLGTGGFYGNLDKYSYQASYQTVPIFIASDVDSASAGYYHTLYVKTDKTCYGMGYNYYYQLGSRIYNSVIYSSDGINWTRDGVTKLPFYKFQDAIYDGEKFIAVGFDDVSNASCIQYSTDGKVWNNASVDDQSLNLTGVAYDGTSKYISVGNAVLISSDGINWTTSNDIPSSTNISYVNDKFIAGNDYDISYYSYDGETWTECVMPYNRTGKAVYGNGTYVMLPSPIYYNKNTFSSSFYGEVVDDFGVGSRNAYIIKDGTLYKSEILSKFVEITSSVKNVSAGDRFVTYVKNDDTLWGIGINQNKQISNSEQFVISSSIQIDTDVSQSFGGFSTTLYIKNDGTLWGRGSNASNALGNIGNPVTESVQIDSDVKYAACGSEHILYIKNDNTLWGCGYNANGELGTGDNNNVSTPVQIDTDVVYASAGSVHSIYIKTDGSLYVMGYNYHGQLGTGDNAVRNVPTLITGSGVVYASAGSAHSHYVTSDGKLYGTGYNVTGQLGTENNTNYNTFQLINVEDVKFAKAFGAYTYIQKTDGTVYSTGDNQYAQLGDGKLIERGLYSNDGINWSASYIPDIQYRTIAYGNGKFVMTTDFGSNFSGVAPAVISSTDGINWTGSRIAENTVAIPRPLIFDGSQFITAFPFTNETYDVYRSADAISWTPHISGMSYVNFSAGAYGDGKYILLRYDDDDEYIATQEKITL